MNDYTVKISYDYIKQNPETYCNTYVFQFESNQNIFNCNFILSTNSALHCSSLGEI